jgi:(p)ppGpp synthase/HD superfamily hydrolase
MENPVQLTPRFTLALNLRTSNSRHLRKGSQVPYMVHLLGVVSRVLGESGYVPFPVKEDMVIAALLQDVVETSQVARSFLSKGIRCGERR